MITTVATADKINENKVAPRAPKKPILIAVPALIRTGGGEADDEE